MDKRLDVILQRISNMHLATLQNFYHNYFNSDDECISFIYNVLRSEPVYSKEHLEELFTTSLSDDNYSDPNDRLFIPRRMLNCVERMVSVARDMEQIRHGKDIFKIVFLVTCIETLQKLSGKSGQKKSMLFDFFEGYTSEQDKEYIRKHFAHGAQGLYPDEDAFWQFISVLNEYRNAAAHEGEYWDYCFKNNEIHGPLSFVIKAQLDKNSEIEEHSFETTLSYRRFEEIFVQTCITFIHRYVRNQEETSIILQM